VSEFGKVTITSTPADNSVFKAHAVETGLYHHIDSEFRHASKSFEGVLYQNNLYRKTMFFREKGSRTMGFDGISFSLNCNENPIYVFPEKELRGLSPNFHIHVSVSDLYIPRIGPRIFRQQKRQTDSGNI
jgi:hypothetical protein